MDCKFISRNCPICSCHDNTTILNLSYDKILPINHTLVKDWFNESTFNINHLFPIVRCSSCQFVFSKYSLNNELQYSFYHHAINEALSREKIYNHVKRVNMIDIWSKLHRFAGQTNRSIKVLDFGAGWGDFLAVAKCFGVEVYGLEFDERKIIFANQNNIPLGGMNFIEKHAPYDIFMCNQVIEHLENPLMSLKILRALMKSGAIGFISVPNFSDERIKNELSIIKSGNMPTKDLDPLGHLNYFNPGNLRKMIFESGFKEFVKQPKISIRSILSESIKKFTGEKIPLGTSLYVNAI